MLEELHAGHDVELAGMARGIVLGGDVLVVDRRLALQRVQLGDASGLHNIWSMGSAPAMGALSLGVVALFAALLTAVSIRAFTRSAVR